MSEPIVTDLRVVSATIKPFEYRTPQPNSTRTIAEMGEVLEIRATGTWDKHGYPVSLHITVYPGCGVIPPTGDKLRVVVNRQFDFGPDTCHACGNENPRAVSHTATSSGDGIPTPH